MILQDLQVNSEITDMLKSDHVILSMFDPSETAQNRLASDVIRSDP